MPSNRIRLVVALAILLPALPFGSARLIAQTPATVAASVQPFVDRQELAGAVMLVADKDKVLAVEAVGWADIAAKKPMQTDSMFWIASQSKPHHRRGADDAGGRGEGERRRPGGEVPAGVQGPDGRRGEGADRVVLQKPKHPITVRNVLSHTSGLPFKSALEEPTLDRFPLSVRVRSYAMTPLEFEPDSKYQYSNAGINTAARIIEVVTGMSFEKFLDERLFQPLGMKDTTFWPSEAQAARIAKAYKPGPATRAWRRRRSASSTIR